MGLAQLQLNQPKAAIDAFRKALTFVPTGWCEPYAQMAAAYTTLGSADEAKYATAMGTYCKNKPADAKKALQALTDGPAGVDAMLGLALIAQTEGTTPTRSPGTRRSSPWTARTSTRCPPCPSSAWDPREGEEHPEREEHYDARTQVR